MTSPGQVKARLFTRRTLVGWLGLCGFVLWQAINGWSNIEFIAGKAPILRNALVAILAGIQAFVVSGWFPWVLLIGGLLWIVVGVSTPLTINVRAGSVRQLPPDRARPEDRAFVYEDVLFLASLYKGRTSLQADTLAELYRGKWMKITGEVNDVSEDTLSFDHHFPDPYIYVSFNKEWRPRFEVLKPGDIATVQGRIAEVSGSSVSFEDCELVGAVPGAPGPKGKPSAGQNFTKPKNPPP
jgi:hypothetical protein